MQGQILDYFVQWKEGDQMQVNLKYVQVFGVFILMLLIVNLFEVRVYATDIESIYIKSTHVFYRGSTKRELLIYKKSGLYYTKEGQLIEKYLVQNLWDAIHEPTINELDISNLGIDKVWLKDNDFSTLLIEGFGPFDYWSTEEINIFLKEFRKLENIKKYIDMYYYDFYMWDDYPCLLVQIYTDDDKIEVFSDHVQALMIPWRISRGSDYSETYNSNISRAIVALLPDDFPNKYRFEERYLKRWIYRMIEGTNGL